MEDTPSQREADLRLVRIEKKLDQIPDTVKTTIQEGEYLLPGGLAPKDLIADHAELHATNARILNALDGPESEYTDGKSYRLREQGLVYQTQANGVDINWIKDEISNGIKTKPPKSIRVAIITASGAIVAASLPTILRALF